MKFYGFIGFGDTVDQGNGVHEFVITEREAYGDVLRAATSRTSGDEVIPEQTINNRISVIADDFVMLNVSQIQYVNWSGTRWTVATTTIERPRLIFTLGGVYNGPAARAPEIT